jgi:hypothetical protein
MSEAIGCDPIKQSLAELAAGKQVVVVEHEDRETRATSFSPHGGYAGAGVVHGARDEGVRRLSAGGGENG